MKCFSVELKVCEACGALWLRAAGTGFVYCRGCANRLCGFPAPRTGRRGRRCNGSAVTLPVVHAVACAEVVTAPVADVPVVPFAWEGRQCRAGLRERHEPVVEIAQYRKYSEALLRKYMRVSMGFGRAPSLLGREMFRGHVSSYTVQDFSDASALCMDVERCLAKLTARDKDLIKRIALQEYTQGEAAAVLGLSLRHVARFYGAALDEVTRMFLAAGLLERLRGCQ